MGASDGKVFVIPVLVPICASLNRNQACFQRGIP